MEPVVFDSLPLNVHIEANSNVLFVNVANFSERVKVLTDNFNEIIPDIEVVHSVTAADGKENDFVGFIFLSSLI